MRSKRLQQPVFHPIDHYTISVGMEYNIYGLWSNNNGERPPVKHPLRATKRSSTIKKMYCCDDNA